jgi:hypothetical protein
MAFETLPTTADAAYSQTTALSGQDYQLDFDYVGRDGTHLLNLSRDDGTLLIGGLALLPGRPLLQGFVSDDRPPGDLLVISDRDIPELGDFGSGAAVLAYLTDEDLDQARAILAG